MAPPIANLWDDFNDTTIDPAKWVLTGGLYTEAGGTICGTVPGSDTIESVAAWSLVQSSAFVEVVNFANGAGATAGKHHFEIYSTVDPSDDVYIEIEPALGTIKYARQNNGVDVETLTETYNSTTMRWWRIRETSVNFLFETSPNGSAWTTQFTAPTQSWANSVKTFLFVSQTGGVATQKCWDNFNVTPGSSRTVSVGTEFEVSGDGELGLNRCDQPDQSWGFGCNVSTYNALRRSDNPCGHWVQPPAKQYLDVQAVIRGTDDQDEQTLITMELTNPDNCRAMLFYLPLTAGMKIVVPVTETGEVYNWTLGVMVTGVDNSDTGFEPITANDFGNLKQTLLWRGQADYFWTAEPGASTTVEVAVKVFAGGGNANLTQLQARLGVIGMSEVAP